MDHYPNGSEARVRIYLAGGKSDWRDKLSKKWEKLGVECIDPFKDSRQNAIAEFTLDDLEAVKGADLVFAYCDYHVYNGMSLEFGYAYALGIPIIYTTSLPRIDSMMVGVAKAAFTDLDAAIKFVEERYLETV